MTVATQPTATHSRYQQITDRIVAALESGTAPWTRPWRMQRPANALSGRPYQSINRLLLELRAFEAGYRSNRWITYAAAQRAGGFVNRGERGTAVIFYQPLDRYSTVPSGDGEGVEIIPEEGTPRLLLRSYTLFNLEQCTGLSALQESNEALSEDELTRRAMAIVQASGATIRYGGDMAAYLPQLDEIRLPRPVAFGSAARFFGTAFHELGHWTGAPHRLNRTGGRFGDPDYAFEELVAEMAAAFVLGEVGLPVQTQNTAAYLKSWLSLLTNDAGAIVAAAREAQRAADYLCGNVIETTDQPPALLLSPSSTEDVAAMP